MKARRTIYFLNASSPATEAAIETAVALSQGEKAALQAVDADHGRVRLRLLVGSLTGSPSFTIDSLAGSIDGTNYRTVQSFAPISITTAGEKDGPEITAPLFQYTHLKLLATVSTIGAGNTAPMTFALECIA